MSCEPNRYEYSTQLERCQLLITGYLRENSTTHFFPTQLSNTIQNFTPLFHPIHFLLFDSITRQNLTYNYPKLMNDLEKVIQTEHNGYTRLQYSLQINYSLIEEKTYQCRIYMTHPQHDKRFWANIPAQYCAPWKKIIPEIDTAKLEDKSNHSHMKLPPINNDIIDIIWKHIPNAMFTFVQRKTVTLPLQNLLRFTKGYPMVNEFLCVNAVEICTNAQNVLRLEYCECDMMFYVDDDEISPFYLTIGGKHVDLTTSRHGVNDWWGSDSDGIAWFEQMVSELTELFPFEFDVESMDKKDLDLSVTEEEWGQWTLTKEIFDQVVGILGRFEEEVNEVAVDVGCNLKTRRE